MGHESDCSLRRRWVAVNVLAAEPHLALAGAGECCQEAEQGGFAGAIWAIEQNGVSRLNAQLNLCQRCEVAKILGNLLEFESGLRCTFHMPPFSVWFHGVTETGGRVLVRLWHHRVWFLQLDPSIDSFHLVAAIALIHRERLRCG